MTFSRVFETTVAVESGGIQLAVALTVLIYPVSTPTTGLQIT